MRTNFQIFVIFSASMPKYCPFKVFLWIKHPAMIWSRIWPTCWYLKQLHEVISLDEIGIQAKIVGFSEKNTKIVKKKQHFFSELTIKNLKHTKVA